MEQKEKQTEVHKIKNTMCWRCQNAVPIKDAESGEYIRGCNWSLNKKPVKGWKAKRNDIRLSAKSSVESYIVDKCPMFLEDEKRRKQ